MSRSQSVGIEWGDGRVSPVGGDPASVTHLYAAPGVHTIVAAAIMPGGPVAAANLNTVGVQQATSGYGAAADAFVTALYSEILGRYLEPAGLKFWAGMYVSHVNPMAIAQAVFASQER